MTKYVVHRDSKHDVYIGRPTIFGNPWSHKKENHARFTVATRKEAIENYRLWLNGLAFTDVLQDKRKEILKLLPELKGKVLGCWCAPKTCHGDILSEMANRKENKFFE